MFFIFLTKHACNRRKDGRTDERRDRQNYDLQDRASIAASRGKNYVSSVEAWVGMQGQISCLEQCTF